MRYYHLAPEQVLRMPRYQLHTLIKQLPALEAFEAQQAATIAMVPHTKNEDRRSFFRRLKALVRPLEPRKLPPPKPTIHDPAAAAAWFAARGGKVK